MIIERKIDLLSKYLENIKKLKKLEELIRALKGDHEDYKHIDSYSEGK